MSSEKNKEINSEELENNPELVNANPGENETDSASTENPPIESEKEQEGVSQEETEVVQEEPAEDSPVDTEKEIQETATSEETSEKQITEAESSESSTEEVSEETSEDDDADTDDEDGLGYYKKLVEKAADLVEGNDYSFISNEMDNIFFVWNDGPEVDGSGALYKELDGMRAAFNERKKAFYEQQAVRREENLVKKKAVLKELADIIENKNWTATKEVGKLKGKWESIKPIPQEEIEALDERFNKLLLEFDEHKIDRLVKKLQKEEENLVGKLVVLDKIEGLITKFEEAEPDFSVLADAFEDHIKQWRKIGRVPAEKADELWERFNTAQDSFSKQRMKFDAKYRKEVEKCLVKKKALIDEAEALIDNENIAEAARQVNKLHKLWKKTGNLPQNDENELWERFKTATDNFNKIKSDNIDQLRDEEKANYDLKLQLVAKAEKLSASEELDWSKGHQAMQSLMDEWKKIGPVPRKKSGKIWKSFKGHMDAFYDKRREHLKDARSEQKDNLNKKREIIKKIFELAEGDDLAKAINEVKSLQNQFKDVGFVPLKQKNKIWKQYREACDLFYDKYRSKGSDRGMERKLAAQGVDPESRQEIIEKQKKLNGLKKEISALQEEINQYNDSITYFKPTKKGMGLQDEIQKKIDTAQADLDKKKSQENKLLSEIDALHGED